MSGMGNRFVAAGYTTPKPLIEIDGMPIIEHVVKMFPGETDFIFICNSKHLQETNMREVLMRIAPGGVIREIPPHKKGPVYAVLQVADLLADEEEVIVNYCDFSCYWDYSDFLKHTRDRKADGAVPAYKGFHPHMLGTTNYAFMRDDKQWMLEIKEKEPFTDNRMQEYASMGTYYFRKGSYVKKYFSELIEKGIDLKGEFYVSLIYNLLVQDGLKVSIYDVQHMLQWGTPQDVEEYLGFSDYFRAIADWKAVKEPLDDGCLNLIPLAGRGSRFTQAGYADPKPLIEVGGKPMIVQAANYLPASGRNTFVCLEEHLEQYPLERSLREFYPEARIVPLNQVTDGQASTCALGLQEQDDQLPLLIGACDNGVIYNQESYQELLEDEKVDAIVWTFRGHPSSARNPQMYGWVKTDDSGLVQGVSVKVPVSDNPSGDHAIVGTFYFRKAAYFTGALKNLKAKNQRINGEFYVDSCVGELVEMGLKVKAFEVDHYLGWGTPDDYLTYKYWQSFFHKVKWHPYTLQKDPMVAEEDQKALDQSYSQFPQPWR